MTIHIVCARDFTWVAIPTILWYNLIQDGIVGIFVNLIPSPCSFFCTNIFCSFVQVNLSRCQPCQFRRCSGIYLPHQTFCTRAPSIKASVADHNEPNEVKVQIGIMKEKLREAMPIPVQEFPWRKAQHTLLDRLLILVQDASKWSLILFFVFGSLSDAVYTFSINRELIIPVGLFVGCIMTDFLKEISLELFHRFEVYFEILCYSSTVPYAVAQFL